MDLGNGDDEAKVLELKLKALILVKNYLSHGSNVINVIKEFIGAAHKLRSPILEKFRPPSPLCHGFIFALMSWGQGAASLTTFSEMMI